jgi:hypothetical protein
MAQKYRELRKREIQMDEFLNNFEANKSSETDQLFTTRRGIVHLLEMTSKVRKIFPTLISLIENINRLNEITFFSQAVDRMNKEGGSIIRKGKNEDVTPADLRKVEELEKKVTTEFEKLKEKKQTMDVELQTFSDLEGLKRKSEARKQQLIVEKQNLSRYKDNIKFELQVLQSQFEAIQAQLFDNDTHNQVWNL